MKKIVATLMVLAALFLVVGCKKKGPVGEPTKGMDRRIVMGYSQIGAESEWRTACTNSVKAAAEEWNIELKFSDAQQKQENQLKAIRSFIQQKVDIIAFTPVVETGWETILQECKDAGIPTICVDRTITADKGLYNCFLGSDFELEGKRAADWLVKYMNSLNRGSEEINIVELQGTMGASAQVGREKAFHAEMAKYPNYKIIKSQTGDFTRAGGKQVMEAFLKSDGEIIDVLFAHNDDMAIGAIQAIEEYGKKPGTDIIIVSVDSVKGAFEAMLEGKLNCTVECNPLLGPQVMETAVKILTDKPYELWVVSEEGVFDQTNAAAAYPTRKY